MLVLMMGPLPLFDMPFPSSSRDLGLRLRWKSHQTTLGLHVSRGLSCVDVT